MDILHRGLLLTSVENKISSTSLIGYHVSLSTVSPTFREIAAFQMQADKDPPISPQVCYGITCIHWTLSKLEAKERTHSQQNVRCTIDTFLGVISPMHKSSSYASRSKLVVITTNFVAFVTTMYDGKIFQYSSLLVIDIHKNYTSPFPIIRSHIPKPLDLSLMYELGPKPLNTYAFAVAFSGI